MRKNRTSGSVRGVPGNRHSYREDKNPLSDICDKYQIQPPMFYRWQKQFFEKGSAAFREEDNSKKNFYEKKIANLEQRLTRKNEVVAELMEESLKLKKNLGEI